MDLTLVLAAGIAAGTVLVFAAVGEIFAERAGVLNLGVEGMMLMGAVAGFSTSAATGNAWLGVLAGMIAGGLLGTDGRPQMETAAADTGALTYHDYDGGTTLVWLSYPAENEFADSDSFGTIQ